MILNQALKIFSHIDVRIHQKNLQLLAIELYKTVNNLNPVFMKEIFQLNELAYNLRKQSFIQKS